MSIQRITVSVPDDLARRAKKAARGTSVSAWVASLIQERLDDAELDRLFEEFYASVGPRRAEVRRADVLFGKLTKRPRHRKSVG